ncbi:hypothetical protein F2Q69_00054869 [Brassica cretica]|uniref:Uncharacterized protein n=1 Tax=Brassica cretica TaxID=69181 RepID=A0A8S9MTM5_BRACR|nr:hypothetical protein F2Q69_00054869 [Brassica cretica]
MIHSVKKLEPDKLFDQKHFQNDNDIPSDFCFRKPCDSFVCFKDTCFDLSFPSHELITDDLFSPTCAWKELMDKHVFKMLNIISCLDTILDRHVQSRIQSQRSESIEQDYKPQVWRFMYSRKMASKL